MPRNNPTKEVIEEIIKETAGSCTEPIDRPEGARMWRERIAILAYILGEREGLKKGFKAGQEEKEKESTSLKEKNYEIVKMVNKQEKELASAQKERDAAKWNMKNAHQAYVNTV